jgi:hypothetical protein
MEDTRRTLAGIAKGREEMQAGKRDYKTKRSSVPLSHFDS